MNKKSKFFRVAVEGQTTDGRKITREQIVEMASTYNPEKYGARVWMEHMRSLFADGAFPAYGDIPALKAEEIKEGELKGKMGLYAQIDATPELVKINQSGQKIYTSIEMDTDFAGSGQAYLYGLGITDSPASLGTEALQLFSQNKEAGAAILGRKHKPENLFSSAELVTIEFEDPQASATTSEGDTPSGLFSKVKELLGKNKKDIDEKFNARLKDQDEAIMAVAEEVQAFSETANQMAGKEFVTTEEFAALMTQFNETKDSLDKLKETLGTQTFSTQRPTASGGSGAILADC